MKRFLLALLLFLFSCSPKPQHNTISISLTPNKQSLLLKGLDPAVAGEISRDTLGNGWQTLVPVYRMPADTDMMSYQPIQPGKYQLADSVVIFTPDTPFVKEQAYFVRWYHFDKGKKATDYLRGQLRPGQTQFTDLIFKQ
ncbi:hypothetical protein [Mucilaginibacter psychrotolerans]|uniref:DUF4861 domain-containing protein n=1 Tax=Mucilaginibacter psychrotolerans TaxID=1524096 RepID=A0A4Y8S5F8_9SPHI|nr:hypothetical protein [Mucilaginibacter psychrotolerans]TFF33697.1 hypothetical protein E2R66_24815 [Mucilaginibacter psychrotolerans]